MRQTFTVYLLRAIPQNNARLKSVRSVKKFAGPCSTAWAQGYTYVHRRECFCSSQGILLVRWFWKLSHRHFSFPVQFKKK